MQRTKRLMDALEPRQLMAVGDLDTTFGGGAGFIVSNLPAGTPVSSVMTLLGDGKLLVAGYRIDNSGTVPVEHFTLARLTANGALDATFGTNGIAEYGSPIIGAVNEIRPTGIAVDSDGTVLVSYFWNSVRSDRFSSSSTFETSLVRYRADGASSQLVAVRRKTSNTGGGTVFVSGETFNDFAIGPDRKIYISGLLRNPALPDSPAGRLQGGVARLNADGSIDATFDGDGYAFPSVVVPHARGTPTTITFAAEFASQVALAVRGSGQIDLLGSTNQVVEPLQPGITRYRSGMHVTLSPTGAIQASQFGLTEFTVGGLSPFGYGIDLASSRDGSVYLLKLVNRSGSGFGTSSNTATNVQSGVEVAFTSPTAFFPEVGGQLFSATTVLDYPGTIRPGVLFARRLPTGATFSKTYNFGGRDEVFAVRDLGTGKLAIAGFTTDTNGVGRVVVVRALLNDTAPVANSVIGGVVFNDANGNGVRDASEVGVSGRTVFIDANKNGALDASEQKTVTGAGGYYELKNLPAGTFSVRQVVPTGFSATTPIAQSVALPTSNSYRFANDFGTRAATATTKPAAPTNLKAVIVTLPKKLVRLTWTDIATNETGYRIERRYRGETAWTSIATLGANATRYDDSSVLKGVVYEYRVVAINSAGTAASGIVSVLT
jgi:uncharacterized delta-60 repeat protein